MLDIKGLFYRYQSRTVFTLKNINLKIETGEMLLLAGRSGCGKSTLIKAISGLLGDGDLGELRGKINFDGKDITKGSPEEIGMLVGTVYQSPDDQLFAMTVADEVGFALENRGIQPEKIKQIVNETLHKVGLDGFEKNTIHQLSGGQRQRLALASILVTKPKLLILDEPVSQMNPAGVKTFMELLQKLNREENIAVLMIEHRVNELYEYFQRLAIMNEGTIIYDGNINQAWNFLEAMERKAPTGIREPQGVKLCKFLDLSQLCAEEEMVATLIKQEKSLYSKTGEKKDEDITGNLQLQMEQVEYTYPGMKIPTLAELSLSLYKHQITAIMGFNGAGKSTLLNMLGGLSRPTKGKIYLGGKDINKQLGKVGYLRQEPDLMLLADTVEEELGWKNKSLTADMMDFYLEKLHLQEYAKDFPLALSKGQRLRVVLGAMLAKNPQLLLLDEPTTGQDEQCLQEITQLLLDYKAQGGSIFICTHDVELAAHIADRVIILKQGRIIADGSALEVLANEKLLQESGLNTTPVFNISKLLKIPACVVEKEVSEYVR